MSKKKGKAAPKKAPTKKAATKAAAKSRRPARVGADSGRTVQATIFIFRTSHGNNIRTSPQRIYANPGDRIEWTVVNMIDGSDVPVTITWPQGGPWGKEPIQFRSFDRRPISGAAGLFKYVVNALDATEDPEIEIPDI